MPTQISTNELPSAVRDALDAVRLRLRTYVLVEGLALLVLVLGAAFWIGLLLDWWFEPSPAVRKIGIVVVVLAALHVVFHKLLRRVFVPISDTSAALLLERRFGQLGDHVLTAVHVASSPGRAAAYNPDLIARTQSAAAEAIGGVRSGELFRRGPLIRAVLAAAIACISVLLFAVTAKDSFAVWLDRMALGEAPWPRRVQLEVVGFPADESGRRVQKLAQEDDYELIVRAKLDEFDVPESVEIRTRSADGRRARDTLTRVGEAQRGRDEYQLYRYQFKRVADDLSFDVIGGDDRVRDLRLRVVERPELFSLELTCEYPAYLQRDPRRLAVTGGMRIPEGTRLTLHASSTKPLIGSKIHTAHRPQEAELSFATQPQDALEWQYGALENDDVLLVHVTDIDGVACREPYRISLAVVPDELPQVAVRMSGIGTAITPDAMIPLTGKITDEYGLEQAWFEFQINGEAPNRRDFTRQPTSLVNVTTIDTFDTRAIDPATGERLLVLEPKQRFTLSLKATDQYDLSDLPRSGSSPQFTLDVVTMSELLALLERRELELRQRFEAIFEKVTDTRNLLSRVEFNDVTTTTAAADAGAKQNANSDDKEGSTAGEGGLREQALLRRRLRVAGSLQNVTQSTDEILGVAEAFDDIHNELTNNRIDNPDLKNRLKGDIADPLHRIGEIGMPALAAQVQLIQTHIDDAAAGAADVTKSVVMADAVLFDMKHVLDRMLELETYNEVISQLRGIMNDQDEIIRRTKEKQRDRLKGMFEEGSK